MTLLLAIDPGTRESGWCILDTETMLPASHGTWRNLALVETLFPTERPSPFLPSVDAVVVEMPESRGSSWVTSDTWETAIWVGRFVEAASRVVSEGSVHRLPRSAVKSHLLGRAAGTDAQIRGVLVDRYGGSRQAAFGVKARPGPLYGLTGDAVQALALAVTWADLPKTKGGER